MMFRVALMSLVRPKAMPSKKAWVERAISRTKEVRLRPSQHFFLGTGIMILAALVGERESLRFISSLIL